MINDDKHSKIRQLFFLFRTSAEYNLRKNQLVFSQLAKNITAELLKDGVPNTFQLTGLIQMFKWQTSNDTFKKYLSACVNNKQKYDEFLAEFKAIGQTGYTAAGKTAINDLNQNQLTAVSDLLKNAFNVDTISEAIILVNDFDSKNVPEVKHGVYSPWLHYINPSIFPIINNQHIPFLKYMGIDKDYGECIKAFNILKNGVNEDNLAMLDIFAYSFDPDKINLKTNAMDFFTEEDFTNLNKYIQEYKVDSNSDHTEVYNALRVTYHKVEYWAKLVQEKLFPNGSISVRKRPTNQANYFEFYQWAKIYPEKNSSKTLAYTIEINAYEYFQIKIDTVQLYAGDTKRQTYEEYRGNPDSSAIVKRLNKEDVLGTDWNYLIDNTVDYFNTIKNHFKILTIKLGLQNQMDNNTLNKKPLNYILYGPPGTGKTFNCINYSLSFYENVEVKSYEEEEREGLKERFNDLLIKDFVNPEGKIAFTTFHQSLSYEDFIEGIKPLDPEDKNSPINYSVKDGIFKIINTIALFEFVKFENKTETNTTKDFTSLYNIYMNAVSERLEKGEKVLIPTKSEGVQVEIFQVSENGNLWLRHHESEVKYTVSENRLAKLFDKIPNLSNVDNIHNTFRQIIGGSNATVYWAVLNQLKILQDGSKLIDNFDLKDFNYEDKKRVIEGLNSSTIKQYIHLVPNYILVIDEINRGNVSQIFGELITLIENDKRAGKDEELTAVLPYSQSTFRVAPNLFILGTMNTADRSVEALDTALRRRFSFIEMMPDYSILKSIGEIDLDKVLKTINKRLCYLINEDHQIGHSYFIGITKEEELKVVFENKIIPLLKEYFYNDTSKIQLVLGEGFVKKEAKSKPKFAVRGNDIMDKEVYSIVKFDSNFNMIEAIKALGEE